MSQPLPRLNWLLEAFGNMTLARKGALLFVLPALAQSALLIGLVIIEIETANYYPRRAAQDREEREATTTFALDVSSALRTVKQFLDTHDALSAEAQSRLETLKVDETKLRDIESNFPSRRKDMVLFFVRPPNEVSNLTATATIYMASYRRMVEVTAAAINAAKISSDAWVEFRPLLIPGSQIRKPEVPEAQFESARKRAFDTVAAARAAYYDASAYLIVFAKSQALEPYDPDASARERYLWITLLLAYSLINMGVLAIAGFLFVRHMLSRLQVVSENGQRLVLGQEIHPMLTGSDEIAALDKSFHGMSDALENSTRVHRLMMEKATDLICSLDRNGRIESVSNAVGSILKYEPQDVLGSHLADYVADRYREKFSEKFKSVVATKSQASFEMPLLAKDGGEVELLWSVIWSAADNSVFCVTHDITETKRAERVQQELVQMVSHDLRSPLVAISGFHEFAERGLMGTFDARGMAQLESAKRSTEQMLTLVNDLLEVERLESGMLDLSKADISLKDVIDAAMQLVSAQALRKNLGVHVQSPVAVIRGDQHRLTQVLSNLLTNAIKFSHPNGQIIIRSEQLADAVKVSITDFGEGLSDEYRKIIFERFSQVRRADNSSPSGTGLGLSICKALVNLHGGEIWVDSEVGKGSTFHFTIPNADRVGATNKDNRSRGTEFNKGGNQ